MNKEELWEELKFEIGSTKIKDIDNRKDKVFLGVGNKAAKVLLVGDDPNLFEDEDWHLKANSSGDFLSKLFELVNIDKNSIYLTNIVKCNAKTGDLLSEEIDFYKDLLMMQIALINPDLIVCLGDKITSLLLEKNVKINEIRGQLMDWNGEIKLLSIYSPSFLMSSDNKSKNGPKWLTWQDMKIIGEFI